MSQDLATGVLLLVSTVAACLVVFADHCARARPAHRMNREARRRMRAMRRKRVRGITLQRKP